MAVDESRPTFERFIEGVQAFALASTASLGAYLILTGKTPNPIACVITGLSLGGLSHLGKDWSSEPVPLSTHTITPDPNLTLPLNTKGVSGFFSPRGAMTTPESSPRGEATSARNVPVGTEEYSKDTKLDPKPISSSPRREISQEEVKVEGSVPATIEEALKATTLKPKPKVYSGAIEELREILPLLSNPVTPSKFKLIQTLKPQLEHVESHPDYLPSIEDSDVSRAFKFALIRAQPKSYESGKNWSWGVLESENINAHHQKTCCESHIFSAAADVKQHHNFSLPTDQSPLIMGALFNEEDDDINMEEGVKEKKNMEEDVKEKKNMEGDVKEKKNMEGDVKEKKNMEGDVKEKKNMEGDVKEKKNMEGDVKKKKEAVSSYLDKELVKYFNLWTLHCNDHDKLKKTIEERISELYKKNYFFILKKTLTNTTKFKLPSCLFTFIKNNNLWVVNVGTSQATLCLPDGKPLNLSASSEPCFASKEGVNANVQVSCIDLDKIPPGTKLILANHAFWKSCSIEQACHTLAEVKSKQEDVEVKKPEDLSSAQWLLNHAVQSTYLAPPMRVMVVELAKKLPSQTEEGVQN